MLKVVRKIKKAMLRRMRLLITKHIKINQKYKPRGIKALRAKDITGVEILEINPPYTSTLDHLDPKFLDDCSPYSRPEHSVHYPGDYIATIKNGRIFASDINNFAVISADNYLLDEVSFQWVDSLVEAKENTVLKVKAFTKPKKYQGRVFSLLSLGASKHYYYHWVFDSLAKLYMLKKSGLFDQVDYFLVPNYQYQYNKDYLTHFGIDESKIINEEEVHHVEADYLMVASLVRIQDHLPKVFCDFFYDSFINSIGRKRNPTGQKIYIARGDAAKSRKVNNESELIAVLETLGFEIYYLSKLSVLDQARIFNSADLIVAVHGGGFSNLVYCEPGTKVLEIYPDQYIRHYFCDISVKRGLAYDYILCKSDGIANDHFVGEAMGLTADIDAIVQKIKVLDPFLDVSVATAPAKILSLPDPGPKSSSTIFFKKSG
jgi:Glycosyltransferase 61